MQMPFSLKLQTIALPSMYLWPSHLKKAILTLAVVTCVGVYTLLAAGLVSLLVLGFSLLLR